MIVLEWNEEENLRLPVYEARRNGIRLASICFSGGAKPWEVQMHLPESFIPLSLRYCTDVAGAKERVQQAVYKWFFQIGVQS